MWIDDQQRRGPRGRCRPRLPRPVAVGGGDDPDVDLDGGVGANPLELALLEDAQQLGLGAQRHLADLVEEDGALVGAFEAALAHGHGAGEGALLVAEQLCLEQGLRQCCAAAFTSGWGLRLLARCSASATSSFPVPDSPEMSTVASEGATFPMSL